MIPGSQALLISIFPPDKRATALGIWSITTLVAPVCGPILGGYICDNYHWSWIFLINLPFGAVSAVLCWRFLSNRESPLRKLPIDRVGIGLLAIWVGALQIMLDTGKDADWFASTNIVLLALVAVIGFVVFIIWELTDKYPIVDLRLFARRNFALGTLAFCLGYAIFFANLLLFTLWLQTQLNYTATWAGLVAAPSGVVAVILTPFAARMMQRIDSRWAATVAFLAFAVSYFLRAGLTADANFGAFALPLMVQGVAMSTFFVSMIAISLDGIEGPKIPSASGISNFTRITAGGFAAAITTTLWDRREALHQSRLIETSTVYNPAFHQALARIGGHGLTTTQGYGVIMRQVIGQSYLLASVDLFWISGWLSLAMIGIVWLAKRSYAGGQIVAAD
jgi:DHA2 family multidrug resistance protein